MYKQSGGVMPKSVKNIVEDAVGSIVKPVKTIVRTPVTGLVEGFNFLMKKLEEKTPEEEKKGVEIDGFINALLDEMKDVEQGIFTFFSEMLFMTEISEKMAQVENEVALAGLLGERVKEFLKPYFIEIFLCSTDKKSFHLAYHYPAEKEFNPANVKGIAEECFNKGESTIFNSIKMEGRIYSVLTAPLRTTRDIFGTIVIGKKGKNKLTSEDIMVTISGAAVVGFSISNIKLLNNIIKNERFVTIGETIGGLSHDIKNILTNLESGIAIMDIGATNNDIALMTEGKKGVRKAYEKMKNLVLSMIDYSREREIAVSSVNINKVIHESLATQKELAREKGVELVEEFDRKIPTVSVDPMRIERMIINLVQNAIDAVKEKTGVIRVGTKFSPEEGTVNLWVVDNGCGIAEENLDKIFDIFYSTKGQKGTGFGLAIVQKIVREHGGTISVESKLNRGTRFIVKIPLTKSGNLIGR